LEGFGKFVLKNTVTRRHAHFTDLRDFPLPPRQIDHAGQNSGGTDGTLAGQEDVKKLILLILLGFGF
jgi:hypothetical protein